MNDQAVDLLPRPEAPGKSIPQESNALKEPAPLAVAQAQPPAPINAEILEALVQGDISRLSAEQRVRYYNTVCDHLGIDPVFKPFDYLQLNGKLVLYANKSCAEQLRKTRRLSIAVAGRETVGDVYVVTAKAAMPDGRVDESTGAVGIGKLTGDNLANALMKAETKAKRRVTLSICGLGMLDETEVETIRGARIVTFDDEGQPKLAPAMNVTPPARTPSGTEIKALYADARKIDPSLPADVKAWAATCIEGYSPQNNPVARQVVEMERRLREMLAAGVTPAATAIPKDVPAAVEPARVATAPAAPVGATSPAAESGASRAPSTAPQAVAQKAPPLEQQEPLSASAAPVEGEYEAAPTDAPQGLETAPEEVEQLSAWPPEGKGPGMSKATQARLFATLGELGIKEKADRLSWAASFGLNVPSFAGLFDNQAAWLADKAALELAAERAKNAPTPVVNAGGAECVACGVAAGEAHFSGCPEA